MRQTNNSMAVQYSSSSTLIKQEPGVVNAPASNPGPSIANVQPDSAPLSLKATIDFSAVANAKSAGPVLSSSFHTIPKPIPKTPGPDPKLPANGASLGITTSAFATKRRESNDNPEARMSKVQCNHGGAGGGFDSLSDTIKNVTSAFDKERRKFKEELAHNMRLHHEELAMKDAECAEEIRKARADCAEEAQKVLAYMKKVDELRARHATELENHTIEHTRQVCLHKDATDSVQRERDSLCKSNEELRSKNKELSVLVDAAERYRREDFRVLERQIDERDARHRSQAMTDLVKTYEKRMEIFKSQMEAEGRAHLAELRTAYERKIASLEAELATLKNDADLRRDVRTLCEGIPGLLDSIYSGTAQLGVFKTQVTEISASAQDIRNQANQLQGFMSAMQAAGVQRQAPPPQFMYYPPPQQHPGPAGRARYPQFHPEPAPAAP